MPNFLDIPEQSKDQGQSMAEVFSNTSAYEYVVDPYCGGGVAGKFVYLVDQRIAVPLPVSRFDEKHCNGVERSGNLVGGWYYVPNGANGQPDPYLAGFIYNGRDAAGLELGYFFSMRTWPDTGRYAIFIGPRYSGGTFRPYERWTADRSIVPDE